MVENACVWSPQRCSSTNFTRALGAATISTAPLTRQLAAPSDETNSCTMLTPLFSSATTSRCGRQTEPRLDTANFTGSSTSTPRGM